MTDGIRDLLCTSEHHTNHHISLSLSSLASYEQYAELYSVTNMDYNRTNITFMTVVSSEKQSTITIPIFMSVSVFA